MLFNSCCFVSASGNHVVQGKFCQRIVESCCRNRAACWTQYYCVANLLFALCVCAVFASRACFFYISELVRCVFELYAIEWYVIAIRWFVHIEYHYCYCMFYEWIELFVWSLQIWTVLFENWIERVCYALQMSIAFSVRLVKNRCFKLSYCKFKSLCVECCATLMLVTCALKLMCRICVV